MEQKKNLLHFVIVGGGPINVEFAGELYSFLKKDVVKWYPDFADIVDVEIIEASDHILGTFNP
jgi:NADH:ubiquinone reductase (non-electrogenic)